MQCVKAFYTHKCKINCLKIEIELHDTLQVLINHKIGIPRNIAQCCLANPNQFFLFCFLTGSQLNATHPKDNYMLQLFFAFQTIKKSCYVCIIVSAHTQVCIYTYIKIYTYICQYVSSQYQHFRKSRLINKMMFYLCSS